ncbi:hypothetical protein EN780_32735 [Mesorhizobium sp. M4B.F.Ca.ET.089.01.1.1]|uniref:hypothetical protein n=1 Tax=Mesorhizobium sp. M4B.F.Ca.ET.089.01.1.1 TaxID=2496662 RepID=UPI000FE3EECE|nr:hypothetical protein [Mesorhizobium sp. M4B.F.Ca.ET.089.01.1.1]RWX60156.1 hypothetical protein EN780_32735 [Mesorhizobium sp. M4B.F.Ca.ET.089.01.1.1]
MSDTNYSPQRIHALLRLLDAQGGQLSFDSIVTWLKPTMRGVELRGSESEHINIRQLIGAANSLGMIDNPAQNQYRLSGPVPASLEGFADAVHDRLIGLEWDHADSIVLEAYAAMVVLTEAEQNTGWLEVNAKDRAQRINNAVRHGTGDDDGESNKRFNATKSSPWKRWMIFLGLGLPMPKGDLYPLPRPTA